MKPKLDVVPSRDVEGTLVFIKGSGWASCPLRITLNGGEAKIARIVTGFAVGKQIKPDGSGTFAIQISTYGMDPGTYRLAVVSDRKGNSVEAVLEIRKRNLIDLKTGRVDKPYLRAITCFESRFGHLGYVPKGTRLIQSESIRRLRERQQKATGPLPYTPPSPDLCNWTPLGPGPIVIGAKNSLHPAESGRTLSIAIDPDVPSRIYIGTAGGGIWKTIDAGKTWSPKSDDKDSLAIGALAIDPNSTNRVFAGTGEYHHGNFFSGYYGMGLLKSEDYGDTWTVVGPATFDGVEISKILFDPNDSLNHMFLACDTGVYESWSGGDMWNLLRAGSASDLVMIIGSGGTSIKLIAGFHSEGVFTSTLSGGSWGQWTQITSAAFPTEYNRIAFGQSKNHPDTIYAAFADVGAVVIGAVAKSSTGGSSWTPLALPVEPTWGANYNLIIAAHPDNTGTAYLGLNSLWKTQTGGTSWTKIDCNVICSHWDHHAFAFHPSNPEVIYDCNDGGVFLSEEGGDKWQQRNRDLATLQFYDIGLHPQHDSIMIGGAQDNGGGFYNGAPVWRKHRWDYDASANIIDGDVIITWIDPHDPSRMFHSTAIEKYILRSSDGGQFWDPVFKVVPATWFKFPFALDHLTPKVCYYGGKILFRSHDAADNFYGITPELSSLIVAIAVHATDPNIIYAGTLQGKVYRVQRTGATWNLPDVTTTDITDTGLPSGISISSIAVDSGGNVWVGVGSVLIAEVTGEFSNDHVFYRPVGSSSWENKSAGLAQANPINTIAIDPVDDKLLFCGGDRGVFRWNSAADQWEIWDHGLPNAPVFRLAIHSPSRRLRAATFGRSVWERPIDDTTCPGVRIYMRDNILDRGFGPTPEGLPHPFDPASKVWHWQSEDIKVDSPPFQTSSPVTNIVEYTNDVVHRNPKQNVVNKIYAAVHNGGVFKANNVRVRAFFAEAAGGLPSLPGDFWTGTHPFSGTPSSTNWTPVGAAFAFPSLESGESAVAHWDFLVPDSVPEHCCILALATCDEDPLIGGGELNPDLLVIDHRHVTLKNLHLDDPKKKTAPGQKSRNSKSRKTDGAKEYLIQFNNPYSYEALFDIVFYWGNLPDGAEIVAAFEKGRLHGGPANQKDKDLSRCGIRLTKASGRLFEFPEILPCGGARVFDTARAMILFPTKDSKTTFRDVLLTPDQPLRMAFQLKLPRGYDAPTGLRFDVVLQSGMRVLSGSTYGVYSEKFTQQKPKRK